MSRIGVVGNQGLGVRSDCHIEVWHSDQCEFEVDSTVVALFGEAIADQVGGFLLRLGKPPIRLVVRDTGALPWVVRARLHAVADLLDLTHDFTPQPKERSPHARWRTRLYVPGDQPKLILNAAQTAADIVILDLEDAVAEPNKRSALKLVREAVVEVPWGHRQLAVRVNAGEVGRVEARELAGLGVDLWVVPKVEGANDVRGFPGAVMPILESPLGVENAFEVASQPGVVAMTLGVEDYVRAIGAQRSSTGEETFFALSRVVNAARAASKIPLASVLPQFEDSEAVRQYATRMRRLGYEGVGVIHPGQIAAVHDAFRPGETEIVDAEAIVKGYEQAVAAGLGSVAVNGRMVDLPVYERALDVLRRASDGN